MTSDDRSVLSLGAFAVAAAALLVAFAAVFFVNHNNDSATATTGGGGGGQAEITVTLTEFAMSPSTLDIPPGGARLTIVNSGNMVHNFAIPDLGLLSKDIAPGGTEVMTVKGDETGTHEMRCTIPGHADSGMKGTVNVGVAGASTDAAAPDAAAAGHTMTNDEMDKAMEEVAAKFPAKTEGLGGQVLEPTILADGTKEWDLTASIVDWEVEPGKIVKAWTYNGTVPGPELRAEVGDKIKIVLHNELPESTSLHLHGVRVPNSMDGVDPYTQAAIRPGESMTYEFEALEPAVGMYHSHHDAQIQIPNGLAGALLIGEMPVPDSLAEEGITTADQQVTMVLNDAGTIGLSLNGKSFPGTTPYTMKVGETMLVHYYNEGLMAHPMHLHQPSGWIIAKDGVPLKVPVPSDTVNIAPGERYTVIYLAKDPGVWAWHCHILNHAEGPTGMFGMVTAVIVS